MLLIMPRFKRYFPHHLAMGLLRLRDIGIIVSWKVAPSVYFCSNLWNCQKHHEKRLSLIDTNNNDGDNNGKYDYSINSNKSKNY